MAIPERVYALGSWECPCGRIKRGPYVSAVPAVALALCVKCNLVAEIMPLLPDEEPHDAA